MDWKPRGKGCVSVPCCYRHKQRDGVNQGFFFPWIYVSDITGELRTLIINIASSSTPVSFVPFIPLFLLLHPTTTTAVLKAPVHPLPLATLHISFWSMSSPENLAEFRWNALCSPHKSHLKVYTSVLAHLSLSQSVLVSHATLPFSNFICVHLFAASPLSLSALKMAVWNARLARWAQ